MAIMGETVRRFGAQSQMLLLGNVDSDADQVELGRRRIDHLRASAHPDPLLLGIPHAEHLVDVT